MNISSYFNTDLRIARDLFLSSCNQVGLRVSSYEGQGTGTLSDDQPIYADVALAGSPDATSLLILAPGGGGQSGFLASAVINAFLRERKYLALPSNVACLLVHAINPKGNIWPNYAVVRDNHALPPSEEWSKHSLLQMEAEYTDLKKMRTEGIALDRAQFAAMPLSSMVPPGWDEHVVHDIDGRFLNDRQKITLVDFQMHLSSEDKLEIFYSDRAVSQSLHEGLTEFEADFSRKPFEEMPSAGLVDHSGKEVNALIISAKYKDQHPAEDVSIIIDRVIEKAILHLSV